MNPILECKGLTKRYGNKTALDQVSFSLMPGKIIGLLGPNGSGKNHADQAFKRAAGSHRGPYLHRRPCPRRGKRKNLFPIFLRGPI